MGKVTARKALDRSPGREFWAGVRAEAPLLLGVFPFGMIYGLLALEAGLAPAAAQSMSAVVFAGSAQFVTTQLVQAAAPAPIIVLTIAVVNLRHALYSASVSPYLKNLTGAWKALLAYLLTDEAYAVAIVHYRRDGEGKNSHWFFLGAGLTLWLTWQISTAAGVFLGASAPDWLPLDFSLALTFLALVIPNLEDKAAAAAASSAGIAAVIAFALPYKLGILLAALIGILVGVWVEQRA